MKVQPQPKWFVPALLGQLRRTALVAWLILALLGSTWLPVSANANQADAGSCVTTPLASGSSMLTLCFTTPAADSKVSGAVAVTVTATSTGSFPGLRRLVFYLNSEYLLTEYQSPYTFTLPTTYWQDGAYTLQVEAVLRDNTTTPQRASLNLAFNNNIARPPANNKMFTPSTGSPTAGSGPFIVAAAGDGASGEQNAANVSSLLGRLTPNLFLYLGDVYEKGSPTEFYNWYGVQSTNFSRFRAITNPTIGNHEYDTGTAKGYFDYWDNIPNYYSFDAGGWHFISLNSNLLYMGTDKKSGQYDWLKRDLAAHAQSCTIVYYHHPLFNIGPEGPATGLADIWALLAENHVEIVLNGHDHDYQRWQPLNAKGDPDPNGVTEFVAGAAGHGLQTISKSDPRVAKALDQNPEAFGVLRLALSAKQASFAYINNKGTLLDTGVIPCQHTGASQ